MARELLAIGVNKYEGQRYVNLRGAHRDAAEIWSFFTKELPPESRFPFERSKLMFSPTKSEVQQYLDNVKRRLANDSVFVFYFAGRELYSAEGGQGGLLCRDAGAKDVSVPQKTVGALSRYELWKFSQNCKGNIFFCFDVCRSAEEIRKADSDGVDTLLYLTSPPLESPSGSGRRWSLASCSVGEHSKDDGSFVNALIDEMRAPLRLGKELRLGDELVNGVTRRLYGRQRPEYRGQSFVLSPCVFKEYSNGSIFPWIRQRHDSLTYRIAKTLTNKITETDSNANVELKNLRQEYDNLEKRLKAIKSKQYASETSDFVNIWDAKTLKDRFVRVSSGTFQMGNALPSDEIVKRWGGNKVVYDVAPKHKVTLTRDYYVCRYPVRRGDFAKFVEATRYKTTAEITGKARGFGNDGSWHDFIGLNWRNPGFPQNDDHPVVCVSWNDVQKYIKWLNANHQDALPTGFQYALPTEAEWEYACRAGTTTEFFWGTNEAKDGKGYLNGADQTGAPNGKAWNSCFPFASGYKATSPIFSFRPNAWGLYDMLGNVWEWCADGFEAYPRTSVVDPVGIGNGSSRMIRGGSWCYGPENCRSASRSSCVASSSMSRIGFRLVLKASAERQAENSSDESSVISEASPTIVVDLQPSSPSADAQRCSEPSKDKPFVQALDETQEKPLEEVKNEIAETSETSGDNSEDPADVQGSSAPSEDNPFAPTLDETQEEPLKEIKIETAETSETSDDSPKVLADAQRCSELSEDKPFAPDQDETQEEPKEEVKNEIEETSEISGNAVETNADKLIGESNAHSEAPKAGAPLLVKILTVDAVFRYCPAGTFVMGGMKSDASAFRDETAHEVTLTKGFWILETPVTQRLWKAVSKNNPSYYKGDELPVDTVSWTNCAKYIKKLNKLGLAPEGYKFDLPTEAEWEYACRAGTTSRYNFGKRITTNDANYGRNETASTPVKKYKPNAWNIYDMHGNVGEWCLDWYGAYSTTPTSDPTGAENGDKRVARGGNRNNSARMCSSSFREHLPPSLHSSTTGFRIVLRECEENESTENAPQKTSKSQKAKKRDVDSKKPAKKARKRVRKSPLKVKIAGLECVFQYCPPGKFTMGSPETEAGRQIDETEREVSLTKGYWLLETPVTQALWKAVLGLNPSFFRGDALPVERVSWNQCADFIALLNRSGFASSGYKFDLPTEAEWEYACRADTSDSFHFGDKISSKNANYGENVNRTSAVKTYKPNAWGLYDMHGNVGEWCKDWYGEYPEGSATDPTGAPNGVKRVFRGGGWCYGASYCRSAQRQFDAPSFSANRIGFRLALREIDGEFQEKDDARNAEKFEPQHESNFARWTHSPYVQNPSEKTPAPADDTKARGASKKRSKNRNAGTPLNLNINGIDCVFRLCPSGTFSMGSSTKESRREKDEAKRQVKLTRDFWILETPVTQELWKTVMKKNASCFKENDYPVETVSWNDCTKFLTMLKNACQPPKGFLFDLPTEAEWEYACRAGSLGAYNCGDMITNTDANFNFNSWSTSRVRTYRPNAWGLYDMHGNVWEWCKDRYGNYARGLVTDPTGVVRGEKRVLRGGSWKSGANECRSAFRFYQAPSKGDNTTGFRIVLRSKTPT